MGDHYNDVNGRLSTVKMSDTLTRTTNEVRVTQILRSVPFWALRSPFNESS